MSIATQEKSFVWFNILKWFNVVTALITLSQVFFNFNFNASQFGIRANEIPLYYESLAFAWVILFLSIGFLNAANKRNVSCIKIWMGILIVRIICVAYAFIYVLSYNMLDQAYLYEVVVSLVSLSIWFIPNYIYLKRRETYFKGYDFSKSEKTSTQFSNKPLADLIMQTSHNLIGGYENSLRNDFEQSIGMTDEEIERIQIFSRKRYLDDVQDSIFNYYKCTNINVYNRLCQVYQDPSLCGLNDLDTSKGNLAGTLYSMCYWAINIQSMQIAPPHECIKLNHLQNDIMDKAIAKLEKELMGEPANNPVSNSPQETLNSEPPKSLRMYQIACACLVIALVGVYAGFSSQNGELQVQITDLQTSVAEKDKEIFYYKNEHELIWKSRNIYYEESNRMASQISYMNKNIALLTKTGNKYHKYGCSYLKDSIYIYTMREALNRGYAACNSCYTKDEENDIFYGLYLK